MQNLLLVAFILNISISFGQKAKPDKLDNIVCILPVECITILNNKPPKPFKATSLYSGRVIIQAKLDTLTMTLTEHKFIFANLYSKTEPDKKIRLSPGEQFGGIKYLKMILPDLIKYLRYLKFKMVNRSGCLMSTRWDFPVTIK
jgi:hypothetical protein